MQIKTTMRYHLTCLKMALVKKEETTRVGENVEKREKSKCPSVDKWVKKCNISHTYIHTYIYIYIYTFFFNLEKEGNPAMWQDNMDGL